MLNVKQNYFVREQNLSASRDSESLALIALALESGKAMNRYRTYERTSQTPLIRAVFKNDYKAVLALLATDIDVNHMDIFGNTALSVACENNHYRIAKTLIGDCRINFLYLNSHIPDGETLLTRACKNGHILIVKLLVESGAYINLPNAEGERALKVASINLMKVKKEFGFEGHEYEMASKICKYLIDCKARMEDVEHARTR
jgi:ankyrin repeat protein